MKPFLMTRFLLSRWFSRRRRLSRRLRRGRRRRFRLHDLDGDAGRKTRDGSWSRRGARFGRRSRLIAQDRRTARSPQLVPQDRQCDGGQHENDRKRNGRLGQKRSGATGSESRLAPHSPERPRQIRAPCALQEHRQDQDDRHQNVYCCQ